MSNTDKIKTEYVRVARELLAGHPERRRIFDEFWDAGKFREAYLIVHETVQNSGISLSNEQRKTDEAFYWEFVN